MLPPGLVGDGDVELAALVLLLLVQGLGLGFELGLLLVLLPWLLEVLPPELREGVVGMIPCCANRSRAEPDPCPPVPTEAPPFD